MKLADLPRALELEAERSQIVQGLRGLESGQIVVIIDDLLCDTGLAEVAAAPLRHALAMRLSCNAQQLRQIGVEPA